jgi:NRPS condensation-like uncharacterized protein
MGSVREQKPWFPLDNAAKIFPEVSNRKETNTFRVQIELKESVDPDGLQKAVDRIIDRFPMFKVRLKNGFFWRYFDHNYSRVLIEPLPVQVCGQLNPKENNGYLFKIFYRDRIIAIEMFHSLSDGAGAFMFLKSVVYEYLSGKGIPVKPDNSILTKDSSPTRDEYEDSYRTYYNHKNRKHIPEKKAFGIKGTPIPDNFVGLVSGTLSTKEVLTLARKFDVTATEYLAALMMWTIYVTKIQFREHLKANQKPVKIFIPVNLRRHFPSQSMRNFTNFVKTNMVMSRENITFEELIILVKEQFKQGMTKSELVRKLSENVAFETNIILRSTPFFLKKFLLKIGYQMLGLSLNTMSLTNVGKVDLPETMTAYVDNVSAAVYSGKFNTVNCAVVSFGDKFKITFTRSIIETTIEREFFRHFAQMGLSVEIESNYVEEY